VTVFVQIQFSAYLEARRSAYIVTVAVVVLVPSIYKLVSLPGLLPRCSALTELGGTCLGLSGSERDHKPDLLDPLDDGLLPPRAYLRSADDEPPLTDASFPPPSPFSRRPLSRRPLSPSAPLPLSPSAPLPLSSGTPTTPPYQLLSFEFLGICLILAIPWAEWFPTEKQREAREGRDDDSTEPGYKNELLQRM
jgi:hypothetical protein